MVRRSRVRVLILLRKRLPLKILGIPGREHLKSDLILLLHVMHKINGGYQSEQMSNIEVEDKEARERGERGGG